MRNRAPSILRATSGDGPSSISFTQQLEAIMSLEPSPSLFDLQLMILKEDWIAYA